MPKVTFLPFNTTHEAQPGESVLDVALNHDVLIQHACGGFCACTTCHIQVESGLENLSEIEEEEHERLENVMDYTPVSRLACQAKVQGDIVVKVMNEDR